MCRVHMSDLPGANGSQTAPRLRVVPSAPPSLPPGPTDGRLATTIALHRDPLGVLRDAQRRFGDVFALRLATAVQVIVAEPAAIAALCDADPDLADAGAARREMVPQASPRSVFGGATNEHRGARERIACAFDPEPSAARAEAIARLAERHLARWPVRRPFRLLARMRVLADEIFVRELLGVEDDARANALARAIGRMVWTPGNPPLTIPGVEDGLLGRVLDAEYRRRRREPAALIAEELRLRRAQGRPGPGVLGMLLGAEPALEEQEDLVEELIALLIAAQEPMAAALTWLALCVARAPETHERLREEGLEGPFGRAVLAESLRLHPPAIGVLRRLSADVEIAGHTLEAGTTAVLPIPLLQRDPRLVPDPDRFHPERYLHPGGPAADLGPGGIPWLAFGGGARSCLGQFLARAELAAVLPALWRRFQLETVGGAERMVLRATSLLPHRGGLVIASLVGD
jgi:cytochrome P450